jgi:hypothetical protein
MKRGVELYALYLTVLIEIDLLWCVLWIEFKKREIITMCSLDVASSRKLVGREWLTAFFYPLVA